MKGRVFSEWIILPPPKELSNDVEYFRIIEYAGIEELAIRVCPNGFPGIVFQHSRGQSAIKNITTSSGRIVHMPTLFLYGQVTEFSIMNFERGPYISVQVVLKPHALRTLFSIDASTLTNRSLGYSEFASDNLNTQLLRSKDIQEYTSSLTSFLLSKLKEAQLRDTVIEESLYLVHSNICSITVKKLLEQLHLSERQFQKRFIQTVGVTPQFYIRVKRFNEAMRLINTGQYERLCDVALALNYYDQSHFIRDIKEFSKITPKSIYQKINDIYHDQVGSSYLI